MKIVKENLNYSYWLNFDRFNDPKKSLLLGKIPKIESWLEEMNITKYKINEDGSIDILGDLNITNKNLDNLPPFIKFNIIYGGFYGNGNNWTSLEGFPEDVRGDFELHAPWETTNTNSKRFTEDEILEKIDIKGILYL